MVNGFSSSMKCATFMVTRPGIGRSIYQELPGRIDAALRGAIEVAHAAFTAEYRRLQHKEKIRRKSRGEQSNAR